MKQLGLVFLMFAGENGGVFPPPDPNNYWGEPLRDIVDIIDEETGEYTLRLFIAGEESGAPIPEEGGEGE